MAGLRAWAGAHGRPPRRHDWLTAGPGHPEGSVVYRLFGSWGAGLVAAGLQASAPAPPGRPGGWDAEAVVEAIGDWAERYGEPPRLVDWNPGLARRLDLEDVAALWEAERPRYPSSSTVRRLLGSWNAGLAAAAQRSTQSGLKRQAPRPRHSADGRHTTAWIPAEVIAALQAHAREHGASPRYDVWACADATGRRPSTSTVLHLFGSWNEALRAAGLPVRREQPARRLTAAQRAAAVRRYAAGESAARVAAAVGCAPKTLLGWVRAAEVEVRAPGRHAPKG